jgi:hypothetical protein
MPEGVTSMMRKPDRIYVFTMHRSASMFLFHRLEEITELCDMDLFSMNHPENDPKHLPAEPAADMLCHANACYGPFRYYQVVPGLNEAGVVVHVRDPRDLLTSFYFSIIYSHRRVNEDLRKSAMEQGIDEFCASRVGYLKRYQDYLDNLADRPNCVLLRYEDMVTDFPAWLAGFLYWFPLKNRALVLEAMVRTYEHQFQPQEEDIYRHKRRVIPGDHKEKLKPETIAQLNRAFAPVLERLGYEY